LHAQISARRAIDFARGERERSCPLARTTWWTGLSSVGAMWLRRYNTDDPVRWRGERRAEFRTHRAECGEADERRRRRVGHMLAGQSQGRRPGGRPAAVGAVFLAPGRRGPWKIEEGAADVCRRGRGGRGAQRLQ